MQILILISRKLVLEIDEITDEMQFTNKLHALFQRHDAQMTSNISNPLRPFKSFETKIDKAILSTPISIYELKEDLFSLKLNINLSCEINFCVILGYCINYPNTCLIFH